MNISSAHSFPVSALSRIHPADGDASVPVAPHINGQANVGADARDAKAHSSPLSPLDPLTSGAGVKQDKRRSGDAEDAAQSRRQTQEEQIVQDQIKTLAARDREVRAHEQAHMAAGGQYAGAATYEFERGPNGVSYAVGGEVPISTSEEATPAATLRKAQIIRRAALAPAEPSPQDRRVAAMAAQMESAARAEIVRSRETTSDESQEADAVGDAQDVGKPTANDGGDDDSPSDALAVDHSASRDRLQRRISSHDGTQSRTPGTLLSLTV